MLYSQSPALEVEERIEDASYDAIHMPDMQPNARPDATNPNSPIQQRSHTQNSVLTTLGRRPSWVSVSP